jgi:hypothetical protein
LQNDDSRRLPEWNHMVAAELPPRKGWSMGASVATNAADNGKQRASGQVWRFAMAVSASRSNGLL